MVIEKGRGLLTCFQESPKAFTLIKDVFIDKKDILTDIIFLKQ